MSLVEQKDLMREQIYMKINKTFICESTYFSCEQVVRTTTHLMKMYRLCRKIQMSVLTKYGFTYRERRSKYNTLDLTNIGMKIKVIDNE